VTVLSDLGLTAALADGRLAVEPRHPDAIQPASIDVRLDRHFLVYPASLEPIDPRVEQPMVPVEVPEGEPFRLLPGGFALGSTIERVRVSPRLAARIEGKSSIGRLGIEVHSTAGWIDPGFDGPITLEIKNVAPREVLLIPGMFIGQVAAFTLDRPVRVPYGAGRGSHYQHQRGPTPSRSWAQFDRLSPSGASVSP
jgi:dCTP deaminase